MTYSDYRKAFKQLRAKPVIMKKFIKFNSPKPRKHGAATIKCRRWKIRLKPLQKLL